MLEANMKEGWGSGGDVGRVSCAIMVLGASRIFPALHFGMRQINGTFSIFTDSGLRGVSYCPVKHYADMLAVG